MPNKYQDNEDLDDVLSSIMQGQKPTQDTAAAKPRLSKPPHQNNPPRQAEVPATPPYRPSIDAPQTSKNSVEPNKPSGIFRRITFALALLIVLAGLGFGGYLGINKLLQPVSPFSQELKDDMGIPLYFPTKLPGSFKIEVDSIQQPDPGVIVYVISDNDNKAVNVTVQRRPAGLALEPLYDELANLRSKDTPIGDAKIGTSSDGRTMVNILTDKAWVIINTPVDTIDDDQLDVILKSLKQG